MRPLKKRTCPALQRGADIPMMLRLATGCQWRGVALGGTRGFSADSICISLIILMDAHDPTRVKDRRLAALLISELRLDSLEEFP